jgi:hypothetical protein
MLNEYTVNRHEFLYALLLRKECFVEVEKCGFVRRQNARRFTNEATFSIRYP